MSACPSNRVLHTRGHTADLPFVSPYHTSATMTAAGALGAVNVYLARLSLWWFAFHASRRCAGEDYAVWGCAMAPLATASRRTALILLGGLAER